MDKQIALFYNPVAGLRNFKNCLDQVIEIFQSHGMQIIPWRITDAQTLFKKVSKLNAHDFHTLVAAGGDGTIHMIVNAMIQNDIKIPLGIFPEGTSNDVAAYLKIPRQMEDYCQVIIDGDLNTIDLGRIGDHYFINVASAGFITQTAHEVDQNLKNVLGKMAYYLKGIEKIPRLKNMDLRVKVNQKDYQIEALMFLVLNGGIAGGFRQLQDEKAMHDGLLDFIAFKPVPVRKLAQLFYRLSRGELLKDEAVFYRQATQLEIDLNPAVPTDLDGELGPQLPWKVEVCPAALQIRVPKRL
jgi:diacylglycerol kinase (ATP)